jgi:hypothetical protein
MLIKRIKEEIAANKIGDALQALKQIFQNYPEFSNDLLVIESRWSKLKRSEMKGVLSADDLIMREAQINDNLISLIELFVAENPQVALELSPPLLKMLDIIRGHCRTMNVPFQTPHLLNAVLTYPFPKIREAFDAVDPDAFGKIKERVDNFIQKQSTEEGLFVEFDWYDLPIIQAAQQLSFINGANSITVKYLLIGILEITSGTRDMVLELLDGYPALHQLIVRVTAISDQADKNTGNLKTKI